MTYSIPDDKQINHPPERFINDASWNSDSLPTDARPVQVFVIDRKGSFVIPFPVVYCSGKWRNASDKVELVAKVGGWRKLVNGRRP